MKISITIRSEDLGRLRSILDKVRATAADVTVFEAPEGIRYEFPFPIVTVSSAEGLDRSFGSEALQVLQDITRSAQETS